MSPKSAGSFTAVEGNGVGTKVLVLESGERLGDGLEDAVAQFDELIRRGRNRLLTLDDGTKVFAEWYGRRRASSSTAPSTRPRRCLAARSCSAGT